MGRTFGYDAIGRLTSHTNDLGAFTLSYLGQTRQITGRSLPSPSTLATTWSYLTNTGDRRLSGITNVGSVSTQSSAYTVTTTPENFISKVSETSDTSIPSPAAPSQQTASYNLLNELTNLSGQVLTYDADGNLTSDGTRNYVWDAENRLVTITYPGSPGKQTAFTYDGLGRRTAITSTPAGGSATATSYLWCGSRICQARNSSNVTLREYYAEGEYLPGTPAQTYYYGPDQIGTVRRVFASTTSAPAFAYDPYGNALQGTAPLTDFNYAGMFYNADSGLYLTQYRAYDPVAGRWLSRDRVGERGASAANLYLYVEGNTVRFRDRLGLALEPGSIPAAGTEPLGFAPPTTPAGEQTSSSDCPPTQPSPAAPDPASDANPPTDGPSPQVADDPSQPATPAVLRGGNDQGSIQEAALLNDWSVRNFFKACIFAACVYFHKTPPEPPPPPPPAPIEFPLGPPKKE